MRVGSNPNKGNVLAEQLKPIVLAVVTHLPNITTAYHSKRLEVVQTCLTTMRQNAQMETTFLVWDNGSIPELREWISGEFIPDVFIQSENIGKTAARTMISRMLPSETILAYSDDDMLFYPDWLRPQIDILNNFPNVSVVTGYPVRTAFRWGIENTVKWAGENGKLETGRFISEEYESDFAFSVGRTPEWHKNYTANDIDYRVTRNGITAYCTAHHCQFVGYADVIAEASKFNNLCLEDDKQFDITLDKLGLRLATTQRTCRHIGNVLDEEIKKEREKWQV